MRNHTSGPASSLHLRLGNRGLLQFELQEVDPERPTVQIPMLILLENLSGFFWGAFHLPEQSCPLRHQGCFGVDVVSRSNLSLLSQRVTHFFFFLSNAGYFQQRLQWDLAPAGFAFSTPLFLTLEVRHYRVTTNPRSGLLRSAGLAAMIPDRISTH